MKHFILSVSLIAATTSMCASCGNKSGNDRGGSDSAQTAADGTAQAAEATEAAIEWHWDYPADVKPDAKVGQAVLSPMRYAERIKENKPNGEDDAYIYCTGKLTSLGDKTSKVEFYDGQTYDMPNSLILPIPEGQTAKAGDFVLTWWKNTHQMETAIVTDAANAAQPTVSFLGMKWALNDDGTVKESSKSSGELEPNSFIVLKDGEVMVGQRVMYRKGNEWLDATIVSLSGDKALLSVFADELKACKLSDLKPVPHQQGIKAGDKVYGIFLNTFKAEYYKVDKVDSKEGRVFATSPNGKPQVFSILEVAKSL